MNFKNVTHFLALAAALFIGSALMTRGNTPSALSALIIDGQDFGGHDWAKTTPVLEEILRQDGFSVTVATTPPKGAAADEWKKFHPKFADFDVVIMNYFGEDWPDETYHALDSYVRGGGGLVGIHAGTSPFPMRPAFGDLCGIAWRNHDDGKAIHLDAQGARVEVLAGEGMNSGHGKFYSFEIHLNGTHPITQRFSSKWLHAEDELYYSLRGPAKNLKILASAKSEITGNFEPMAWTIEAEKGRSFMTALGHAPESRREPEFVKMLIMGSLWAAGSDAETLDKKSLELARRFPPQGLLREHLDPVATPMEKFAIVRLPIKNGVKPHNPSTITSGPDGTIYAANYSGEIYTLVDADGDGLEDTAQLFAKLSDLPLPPQQSFKNAKGEEIAPFPYRYPCGLGMRDGWLYVATTQAILRFKDDDGDGQSDRFEVFASGWPYTDHYFDWTFGIRWDAEGNLYTILCTDYLNAGKADDPLGLRGSILKISPDGKKIDRFAYGLRYAYDLAFNDQGDLFFTDNKSGGNPTEEFNHAVKDGNYGHEPKNRPEQTSEPRRPIVDLNQGYAPTGVEQAPPGKPFGGRDGDMFIAAWGPDGVWTKGNILRLELKKKEDGTYEASEHLFADHMPKIVDLVFSTSNANLYVAQFGEEGPAHTPIAREEEGGFYRVIPAWWLDPSANEKPLTNPLTSTLGGNSIKGHEIFTQRTCATCHSVDGTDTLLGPDLKSAGWALGMEGLIEAIEKPSLNIKTDYDTRSITMKDGTEYVGIVKSVSNDKTKIIFLGNSVIIVNNADITDTKILPISLMPEGLAAGLSESDKTDLLAYLHSLEPRSRTLRVNCGGQNATTPANSAMWLADNAYTAGFFGWLGGQSYENNKLEISDVFRTCRVGPGGFEYRFDVTPGAYEVTLLFCEPFFVGQPGKRVFSVDANGQEIIHELDVAAKTAATDDLPNKPAVYQEIHKVSAIDAAIILKFRSIGINHPIVSAIQIRPLDEKK